MAETPINQTEVLKNEALTQILDLLNTDPQCLTFEDVNELTEDEIDLLKSYFSSDKKLGSTPRNLRDDLVASLEKITSGSLTNLTSGVIAIRIMKQI